MRHDDVFQSQSLNKSSHLQRVHKQLEVGVVEVDLGRNNLNEIPKMAKGRSTLPKTNGEFTPENGWLEDVYPIGLKGLFSGANC